MAFQPEDRWIWDFWILQEKDRYHMWFLQAPRSSGGPELRHWNVTIGQAVSEDLSTWEEVGTAIGPGPTGDWDDAATWTGCTVAHEGRWYLFYTGASSAEDALIQRIGVAVSDDLFSWEKHAANPILEADPAWYELLDLSAWHDQAWRDPWVYRGDHGFEMLITARSRFGPAEERGVLGHARSSDLLDWTAGPPVTLPGGFGHMEVPQRIMVEHQEMTLFSCRPGQLGPSRLSAGTPVSGCYALSMDGGAPRTPDDAFAMNVPNLYSCRAVRDPSGRWVLMGFALDDGRGGFAGGISDPVPLDRLIDVGARPAPRR